MSYKSLSLLILPFLVSCTFGKSAPADFTSMYKAHVTAQIATLNDTIKDLGYMDSYAVDGSLRMAASMPSFFSGVLSTDYSMQVGSKRETNTVFKNVLANYDILGGSGKITAKEVGMISKAGDIFFRYVNLDSQEMIDSEMMKIFAKYNNTWLAMTKADILDSLSGSSEDEVLSYKISQALTELTLSDVERYLTTYPIWKETKDLGISGTLHQYEVELAKDNLIAIAQDFSKKATGKELTPDSLKNITENLSAMSIKGVISFNNKDAREAQFTGTLADTTGSGTTVDIAFSETKDGLSLTSGNTDGTIAIKIENSADNSTNSSFIATASGKELVRIESILKKRGSHIQSLDMTLTTAELTVTLNHTNNTDGTFEGKLNGGIGNITWKGKVSANGINDLHITGAAMGTSLAVDLTPGTDGILKGPIVVKSGDTEAFRADAALAITKERFFLSLDIQNPEDPTYKTHGEIDIKAKRTPWNGTIETPKDTKSLKSLSDDFGTLTNGIEINGNDSPITNQ